MPRARNRGTLGQAQLLELLGVVATSAVRAGWFQEWLVHRRLRPEELGGRINTALDGGSAGPLSDRLLDAPVLEAIHDRFDSYLLPQAFPDGSPLHPSYPSGHAVVAGACTTLLKAFFDEAHEIGEPVVASEDGLTLEPYDGVPLLAGPELDKLATNVAYGRNAAGLHYRSDGNGGFRLGEAVAVAVLRDVLATLPEPERSFRFTSFDGEMVEIA